MSKATRMLTMAGMALVAGATIAVGPSAPAAAAPQGTAATTQSVEQGTKAPRERFIGTFRSRRECQWAGRRGEWRDRWDYFYCQRTRWGRWGLWVGWRWNNDNNHGGGGWNNNDNDNNHGGGGWNNNDNNHHGGGGGRPHQGGGGPRG
ncbi:hypothetical protein [Actinoplanes sp. NPDC049118]|uniref:hypothetical protein n=1 Tax=Actinoplanes sp. NPDC049118 TaxID=3155769 RepID=UPI0034018AC7